MAKYLVETYYTCSFKVKHYLDDISETELSGLEKRDDGKFEILDVKLDNRKTRNLDGKNIINNENNENVEIISEKTKKNVKWILIFVICLSTFGNNYLEIFMRKNSKPEFNKSLEYISKSKNKNIVLISSNKDSDEWMINYLKNLKASLCIKSKEKNVNKNLQINIQILHLG